MIIVKGAILTGAIIVRAISWTMGSENVFVDLISRLTRLIKFALIYVRMGNIMTLIKRIASIVIRFTISIAVYAMNLDVIAAQII